MQAQRAFNPVGAATAVLSAPVCGSPAVAPQLGVTLTAATSFLIRSLSSGSELDGVSSAVLTDCFCKTQSNNAGVSICERQRKQVWSPC